MDEVVELGNLHCFRGHLELTHGRSSEDYLDRAAVIAAENKLGPATELATALARLRGAQQAFGSGRSDVLVRGQLIQDYTEDQRRWLVAQGALDREKAQLGQAGEP